MTPENFVYWLQGYLELQESKDSDDMELNFDQVKCIQEHLKLVLKKETHTFAHNPWDNKNLFVNNVSHASC